MQVVIFGATGLIGSGVLLECLDSEEVEGIRVVGRRPTGLEHPKLTELEHGDFLDFSAIEDRLTGLDACFWCLGASSAGMAEADYRRLTVDFTRAASETLHRLNPGMSFSFVSGMGTDPEGRQMWARAKGEAELIVLEQGFAHAAALRPGAVAREGGAEPRGVVLVLTYALLGPFLPWLQRRWPSMVTSNRTIGRAMIHLARDREPAGIFENRGINELARG